VAVAQQLGVSSQAISQWERDEHLPGIERLTDLARILNTNVDWLAKGTGTGTVRPH
jgi:transcriptional regulator with XRE-family HTH domain